MLIAHKAVELSKVKVARRKVLSAPHFLDDNYIAQPKYDGCFAAVTTFGGDFEVQSRTGERIKSCDHLGEEILSVIPPYNVVFGEAWCPNTEQATISGDFRRHSASPNLKLVVFDMVTRAEFIKGYSPRSYTERRDTFMSYWCPHAEESMFRPSVRVSPSHNPGTYGNHEALRDEYLAKGGYDGLILRNPYAPWIKGNGTDGDIIKAKRVLSFDLEVLGVNEGTGKMKGLAGTLTLRWKDGRTIEAGGLDYLTREAWLMFPERIIGKIVEVEAMDYSSDGVLREPRIKSVRFDKEKADF